MPCIKQQKQIEFISHLLSKPTFNIVNYTKSSCLIWFYSSPIMEGFSFTEFSSSFLRFFIYFWCVICQVFVFHLARLFFCGLNEHANITFWYQISIFCCIVCDGKDNQDTHREKRRKSIRDRSNVCVSSGPHLMIIGIECWGLFLLTFSSTDRQRTFTHEKAKKPFVEVLKIKLNVPFIRIDSIFFSKFNFESLRYYHRFKVTETLLTWHPIVICIRRIHQ